MAAELRAAGVRAEVYVGGSGMKAQMKYADKRASPVTVIIGDEERQKCEVTIKDMRLGSELSKKIDDNAEWRESQAAQQRVPRARLVEEVKRALKRV
jgi:histidyl-tRNA synthetase